MEPTLKSKSFITITIVIVKATTANMLICWLILIKLFAVRNVVGKFMVKKITILKKPINVPYFFIIFIVFIFYFLRKNLTINPELSH